MAGLDADFLRALKRKALPTPVWPRSSAWPKGKCVNCVPATTSSPVYKRVDTCAAESSPPTPPTCTQLRRRARSQPHQPRQDHGHRWRPEPYRSGHRVDLLLRTRGAGPARRRLRDHHGQLQPGDRPTDYDTSDRLLLRAGDPGRCWKSCASKTRRASSSSTAVRPRSRWRGLGSERRAGHRGPARMPSTARKTASASSPPVERLGPLQPENGTVTALEQAVPTAERITHPLVVRPPMCWVAAPWKSSMTSRICAATAEAVSVSNESPVLLDRFWTTPPRWTWTPSATADVVIGGIMELRHRTGRHPPGDSACSPAAPHPVQVHPGRCASRYASWRWSSVWSA